MPKYKRYKADADDAPAMGQVTTNAYQAKIGEEQEEKPQRPGLVARPIAGKRRGKKSVRAKKLRQG